MKNSEAARAAASGRSRQALRKIIASDAESFFEHRGYRAMIPFL
jgi:hypothetical protein